jgi:hypothetical protein
MTMRLDVMTNDAGELVRREHARDLGANVVLAIYRLAKLAQFHDLQNKAFQRQLEQTHAAIMEYGLRAGTNVCILFAEKAVFVSGQLLKGDRATYEQASELGGIMEWCGGAELLIQRDVTAPELHQFAEAISVALRSAKREGYSPPSPRIRLRAVADAARVRGFEVEVLSTEQRVVRTYASAIVIMRRFFEDLGRSRYVLPRRIKRVAQSLVDLSDGSTPAFLGVTEVRNQNHDSAGRAVNTAILAVTMAREVTQDRVLLAQIAMAAMMHDVGRPRAAALSAGRRPGEAALAAKISEDSEDKLAAGTAAVLTALGRVNEPTIMRTVVAYEALWLRRRRFIGPLYRSLRLPTLHAKILQIARRYNDLLTPEPGLSPPSPDFAVATLADEMPDAADRTILRMLVAALGFFPAGTVVRLTSNEIAEVLASPPLRVAPLNMPVVRLVMDADGGVLDRVVEVDLANPRRGEPTREIANVVSIDGWRKGIAETKSSPSAPSQTSGTREVPRGVFDVPSDPSSSESGVVENSRMAPRASPETGPTTVDEASSIEDVDVRHFRDLAPTARGTLATTPLVHILVLMLDQVQTGTVVLREPEDAHHFLYFEDGAPSVVRSSRPKVVPRQQDLREVLGAERAKSVGSAIAALANLPPETEYAFYSGQNPFDSRGGDNLSTCHPLHIVLATVRAWHDRVRIRATLGRIAKQPLVFHPDADLSIFQLTEDETMVLDAIRAMRSSLTNLYQQRIADEEALSSLVYTLAVTRCFTFTTVKGPPIASKVFTRQTLPRIPRPLEAASVTSFPPAVQSIPPPTVAPAGLNEAHGEPDGERDYSERALEAMVNFRKASTALDRNDLATAEQLAKRAALGDPENAEYRALVAWLMALSGTRESAKDALTELNRVLKVDAFCERALLYRGKLLKKENRNVEALRDFMTVLELNPRSNEAASEVRFLRMKRKK